MDLPHTPSSPFKLYTKSFDIIGEFRKKFRKSSRKIDYEFTCSPRDYGCKVRIVFYSPNFCQCEDSSCEDGKYILQKTILRVKSDSDVQHLEVFLTSQYEIWVCTYCSNNNSDSSD